MVFSTFERGCQLRCLEIDMWEAGRRLEASKVVHDSYYSLIHLLQCLRWFSACLRGIPVGLLA